ncbi:TPA: hypothetical protein IHL17_004961, partial [Escherichia coli]|nr:hypothetical protein [Escherichia coli]
DAQGHPFALQSQDRPTGHDHADLRRRMPQLARAPASLRRPGALQQGGARYCACERQRATGATLHCCIRLAFSTP